MDLPDSDDEDSTATAFLQYSSGIFNSNSSSEGDVKDIGHALAEIHFDDDSEFRSGYYRPKYTEHQAYRLSLVYVHTPQKMCAWHLEHELCGKKFK